MSQLSFPKCAATTLAAAAWLLANSNVQAAEPNQASTATSKTVVAASDVVIAGDATGTMRPEDIGPYDRYGIGSSCHPAYTPSWMACAKAAGRLQVASLKDVRPERASSSSIASR
jgi:hypothetical protein